MKGGSWWHWFLVGQLACGGWPLLWGGQMPQAPAPKVFSQWEQGANSEGWSGGDHCTVVEWRRTPHTLSAPGESMEMALTIRRYYGTASMRQQQRLAGLMPEFAQLIIAVYQPSGTAAGCGQLSLNGFPVGILRGEPGCWRCRTYRVPAKWLEFPSAPGESGENRLRIDALGEEQLAVQWVSLQLPAAAPVEIAAPPGTPIKTAVTLLQRQLGVPVQNDGITPANILALGEPGVKLRGEWDLSHGITAGSPQALLQVASPNGGDLWSQLLAYSKDDFADECWSNPALPLGSQLFNSIHHSPAAPIFSLACKLNEETLPTEWQELLAMMADGEVGDDVGSDGRVAVDSVQLLETAVNASPVGGTASSGWNGNCRETLGAGAPLVIRALAASLGEVRESAIYESARKVGGHWGGSGAVGVTGFAHGGLNANSEIVVCACDENGQGSGVLPVLRAGKIGVVVAGATAGMHCWLESPDGATTITLTAPPEHSGIPQHIRGACFQASAGAWRFHCAGGDKDAKVTVLLRESTPALRLEAWENRENAGSSPMIFQAFMELEECMMDGEVTMELVVRGISQEATGIIETIPMELSDDGSGLFLGHLSVPLDGFYHCQITATAKVDGMTLRRSCSMVVAAVDSGSVSLTPVTTPPGDSPFTYPDEDNDGIPEGIAVTYSATGLPRGFYCLQGDLCSADGQQVVHAATWQQVQPGENPTFKLFFCGGRLEQLLSTAGQGGLSGWRLQDVVLSWRPEDTFPGAVQVWRDNDSMLLPELERYFFATPAVGVAAGGSDCGQPTLCTNPNTGEKWLEITVPWYSTPHGKGYYQLGATLFARDGRHVATATVPSIYLEGGAPENSIAVPFAFPAKDILNCGEDGEFTIGAFWAVPAAEPTRIIFLREELTVGGDIQRWQFLLDDTTEIFSGEEGVQLQPPVIEDGRGISQGLFRYTGDGRRPLGGCFALRFSTQDVPSGAVLQGVEGLHQEWVTINGEEWLLVTVEVEDKLYSQGESSGVLRPGDEFSLQVEYDLPPGVEPPQSLTLLAGIVPEKLAEVCHPWDENRDMRLSDLEVQQGWRSWCGGMATNRMLLWGVDILRRGWQGQYRWDEAMGEYAPVAAPNQ